MKNYHKNLTIIIVTFQSEYYLNNLLNKLKNLKVVIVENSNDNNFKKKIESKYKNVTCILTGSNIGFGRALNLAIKKFKSKFYLIMNPDCKFELETITQLYNLIMKDKKISVISPTTIDKKNRLVTNHGYFISTLFKKNYFENHLLKQVDFVIGHFFLINKNIFRKVGVFDKNIFLNYEEIDLFKRLKSKNYKIFIHKKTSVKHLGGQSCFIKRNKLQSIHEFTKTSKWHLAWSKFYYYKKNYNYLIALTINLIFFFQNTLKYLFFLIKGDIKKKEISLCFIQGSWASFLNKKSFYRPKV